MSIIYSDFLLDMLRARRVFLFDLDSTLVKTEWSYILAILRQVIKNCGGRVFPEVDMLEAFWVGNGIPRDDFIKSALKIKPTDFWREYHHLDLPESRLTRTSVISGVENNLNLLNDNGKLLGIVTAAYPALAQAEAGLINVTFDSVLSVSMHPELRPKPAPDGLLWSMEQLGCSQDETIYVGDSAEDYAFAMAAGVDFIHYQHHGVMLFYGQQEQPLATFDNWHNSPFLVM